MDLARDSVNEPGNQLYPESRWPWIKQELPSLGIEVEVLDEAEMERLGFGALLALGRGSMPGLCPGSDALAGRCMRRSCVAFVGKGVTFDTGGISLKPANGMEDMTMDMVRSAAAGCHARREGPAG